MYAWNFVAGEFCFASQLEMRQCLIVKNNELNVISLHRLADIPLYILSIPCLFMNCLMFILFIVACTISSSEGHITKEVAIPNGGKEPMK